MTDQDMDRLFRLLHLQKRRKVIRSLLVGNDTCCFTTDQYIEGLSVEIYKEPKKLTLFKPYARKQLREEKMKEVSPDVWAVTAEGSLVLQ